MRSGYVRPMCKDCYNARKRELQGGAIRAAEKRLAQLKTIIISIDGCTLLDNYRSDEGEYRIVLGYKGRFQMLFFYINPKTYRIYQFENVMNTLYI